MTTEAEAIARRAKQANDCPATLTCLLALVQEAWPNVVIRYDFGDAQYNGLEHYTGEEAPHTFIVLRSPESLVAALEAAP